MGDTVGGVLLVLGCAVILGGGLLVTRAIERWVWPEPRVNTWPRTEVRA